MVAAIGGSTNMALHLPAIGHEAGVDVSMNLIDELCRTTPYIARIYPAGKSSLSEFHDAGGVPVVMREILPCLHGEALTVSGGRGQR